MKTLITFSIDQTTLSEEESTFIHSLFAEWVVISTKNARVLVDALIPEGNIPVAVEALQIYNPVVIGTWDFSGNLLSTFNEVEYISMLPPIITTTGDLENPTIIETPRTEAIEIHKFGGWGDRKWA